MTKKLNFKNNIQKHFTITPIRVAILGILLALLVTLKYSLGFVPGIELVSFVFIILGIFLPTLDLLLLIISFNALMLVIYGFGPWWCMYWVIWPIQAFTSKIISKQTKNKYIFGIWGFIAGSSIGFWYFWLDVIFFGWTFARLNLITAIPINVIEGLTTMICVITVGPSLAKVFQKYSEKFWHNNKDFLFAKSKKIRINLFFTTVISLVSFSGIIALYVKNDLFFDFKNRESRKYYNSGFLKVPANEKAELIYDKSNINSLDGGRTVPSEAGIHWGSDGNSVIPSSDYNKILEVMHKKKGAQAAVVIIANGKFETEIIDFNFEKNTKVFNLLHHLKRFGFNFHSINGKKDDWIGSFKYKNPKNKSQEGNKRGSSTSQNYNDYYPLYYINHKFSNLGVANMIAKENDIIEITYDYNA